MKIAATLTLNGTAVPVELDLPDELIGAKPTAAFLSDGDLRARWTCSARTLHRLRATRRLPYYKPAGGSVLYALADVQAFETASRTDARTVRCKVARRA